MGEWVDDPAEPSGWRWRRDLAPLEDVADEQPDEQRSWCEDRPADLLSDEDGVD
jgi:hypothetical protein